MPRSRRNERGNCGGIVLIIAIVLGVCLAAWMWAALSEADDQRCHELRAWYSANPYDSNPALKREYERVC
jgi:hypothetical protein